MAIDFLIVGQGLAGSLLAWELIQRNCSVMVIDNGKENASQIAAGLINPITGLRFVKSADLETVLPAAITLYQQLSSSFQQHFYEERPMLRFLQTKTEQAACKKRLQDPGYLPFLGSVFDQANPYPFPVIKQKQCGFLHTRPLLSALKRFLIEHGSFRQCRLNYRHINWQPKLTWQDLTPKRIIFCEGYRSLKNPWFSYLPLQPVKGEILTLTSVQKLSPHILNFGQWLIPIDAQRLKTGATFVRNTTHTKPTELGKQQLLQALSKIAPNLAASSSMTAHHAGIRPCTPDRSPFLGKHPNHPDLWIFNGFGAKGSLQIPWYCKHLADALLTGKPLLRTCDIQRL